MIDLINGISSTLYNIFGNTYKIYADNSIQQGLKNPCFFISVLNPSQKSYLKGKYLKNNPFIIQYFPEIDNDNIELLKVAEQLSEGLEFITLLDGSLVRGSKISYEIVDGILHFKVSYNVFVKKQITIDNEMDNLSFKR